MGWGYCGINRRTGQEMGYCVDGTCHHPGCNATIDHGLSYVCGSMHGGGESGCGYYFCGKHLSTTDGTDEQLCDECLKYFELYSENNTLTK